MCPDRHAFCFLQFMDEFAGEIDDSGQMVLRRKYVDAGVKAQSSTYTGKRRVSGGREVIEGSWTDSKTADSGPFLFEKLHEAVRLSPSHHQTCFLLILQAGKGKLVIRTTSG